MRQKKGKEASANNIVIFMDFLALANDAIQPSVTFLFQRLNNTRCRLLVLCASCICFPLRFCRETLQRLLLNFSLSLQQFSSARHLIRIQVMRVTSSITFSVSFFTDIPFFLSLLFAFSIPLFDSFFIQRDIHNLASASSSLILFNPFNNALFKLNLSSLYCQSRVFSFLNNYFIVY